MIASDPKIQYCVTGRDLSQIDPNSKRDSNMTVSRFPNLLNQVKMQIALAALRQAQTNYQAKYNEYLAKATKDASADIAQYMCQMLPMTGGAPVGGTAQQTISLAPPYAISYVVGAGLDNTLLTQGGHNTDTLTSGAHVDLSSGANTEDVLKRETVEKSSIAAICTYGVCGELASNAIKKSIELVKSDFWFYF